MGTVERRERAPVALPPAWVQWKRTLTQVSECRRIIYRQAARINRSLGSMASQSPKTQKSSSSAHFPHCNVAKEPWKCSALSLYTLGNTGLTECKHWRTSCSLRNRGTDKDKVVILISRCHIFWYILWLFRELQVEGGIAVSVKAVGNSTSCSR